MTEYEEYLQRQIDRIETHYVFNANGEISDEEFIGFVGEILGLEKVVEVRRTNGEVVK